MQIRCSRGWQRNLITGEFDVGVCPSDAAHVLRNQVDEHAREFGAVVLLIPFSLGICPKRSPWTTSLFGLGSSPVWIPA